MVRGTIKKVELLEGRTKVFVDNGRESCVIELEVRLDIKVGDFVWWRCKEKIYWVGDSGKEIILRRVYDEEI